jgi:hypothetical protein
VPRTLICDRRDEEEEENSIAAMLNGRISKPPSVAIITNNIATITSEAGRWKDSCLVATADKFFNPISDRTYSSACFYISNANSSNIERKQEPYK